MFLVFFGTVSFMISNVISSCIIGSQRTIDMQSTLIFINFLMVGMLGFHFNSRLNFIKYDYVEILQKSKNQYEELAIRSGLATSTHAFFHRMKLERKNELLHLGVKEEKSVKQRIRFFNRLDFPPRREVAEGKNPLPFAPV